LGHDFDDPVPTDDNPSRVEVGENLARASSTSKFQATAILPGVSSIILDPYVEYVPFPVPRAPRSVSKRARADDAFAGVFATKKPRQLSTHLGTQVVGSMLLGEHINMFCHICCLFVSLTEYFLLSQMVLWLSCSRMRRMRMMMRPSTHVGELSLYFGFLAIILALLLTYPYPCALQ
jgi:hypothetical protein